MPLTITYSDITTMHVDAIVNIANTPLEADGGVCGAIFAAAGIKKLKKACGKLAPIQTGGAALTKGFALPAKYIIHTASPVCSAEKGGEEALLHLCYTNALDIAKKRGCKTIAIPLVSGDTCGYTKEEVLSLATNAISEWLMSNDMEVSLVISGKTSFALSQELLGEVKAFIGENYVDERTLASRLFFDIEQKSAEVSEKRDFTEPSYLPMPPSVDYPLPNQYIPQAQEKPKRKPKSPKHEKQATVSAESRKIKNIIVQLDEPFSATLLRLIDDKGSTDIEIYKRANIDRKLFSKIRTGKGYMPSKKTIIALAVALELSLTETRDLLETAGFAISRSVVFDVIIEYFITQKKYDIFEINNVLFEYDQPILGG